MPKIKGWSRVEDERLRWRNDHVPHEVIIGKTMDERFEWIVEWVHPRYFDEPPEVEVLGRFATKENAREYAVDVMEKNEKPADTREGESFWD